MPHIREEIPFNIETIKHISPVFLPRRLYHNLQDVLLHPVAVKGEILVPVDVLDIDVEHALFLLGEPFLYLGHLPCFEAPNVLEVVRVLL